MHTAFASVITVGKTSHIDTSQNGFKALDFAVSVLIWFSE